jgi:hypothetical protein
VAASALLLFIIVAMAVVDGYSKLFVEDDDNELLLFVSNDFKHLKLKN